MHFFRGLYVPAGNYYGFVLFMGLDFRVEGLGFWR